MKKLFTLLSAVLVCLGASAQNQKLADVIKSSLDTCKHEIVPVFLDGTKTYELDSYVDFGTRGAIVWGDGATIVVSGDGQIATSAYLQFRNANFDCAMAGVAPFAMSKEPDASLKINDEGSAIKFEGANQKVFWNEHAITIENCNFANLKKSLFYGNKQPWALHTFKINDCVIQLEGNKLADGLINLYGASTGAIKNIVLTNNTIYNITPNSDNRFVRYGNASNSQPQKIWGSDANVGKSVFTMTNNTIAYPCKEFANNFPNKGKLVFLDWTKNIFVDVTRLQKIGTNNECVHTAADNVLFSTTGAAQDGTDLKKFGTEENVAMTIPTTALDFANIAALKANFAPAFATNATCNGFGDTEWNTVFKTNIVKTPGTGYEVVLGPDMISLDKYAIVETGVVKPGINVEAYPWITYVRGDGKNVLTNGQNEVQNSDRWTDLDPVTGVKGEWIQATGANGSVKSPVISEYWNKWMEANVKGAKTFKVYATGSASSKATDGIAVKLTATGTDGSVVEATSTPGAIYGKGTASDAVAVELNPAVAYVIKIEVVSETKTSSSDVQITGFNIIGEDTTPFLVCHTPGLKYPGTNWEVVLGPDMLDLTTLTLQGGCNEDQIGNVKPGINTAVYPWISYVRGDGKNILSNGQNEAQKSNRWTDINPATGEKGEWIQATGKDGSVESPVISEYWNKYMVVGVKDATEFKVYATGSASSKEADGIAVKLTATTNTGKVVTATSTPGKIYGKGTSSDVVSIALNPAEAYNIKIEVVSESKTSSSDVQITGFNLVGKDTSVFPVCHAPGEKYPGTNWEVVLGPDMISLDKYSIVDTENIKPGIDVEAYPWISYVRGDGKNVLTNGQNEVQKSNRWTDINPATGVKGEWLQATGANGSVESPVISEYWNKWMEVGVMDATEFKVYATGSASSKEADGIAVKLTATSNAGEVLTATSTPGAIYGKGTASDVVAIALNPEFAYSIKIEVVSETKTSSSDVQITGFNLTGTDLTIAPSVDDENAGGTTGIENVENVENVNAPAYNVAGQRVNANVKGLIIKGGKKFIVK